MKRKNWPACLTGFLLSIWISFSSISCLISATHPASVSMDRIFLVCAGVSLLGALGYTLRVSMVPMGLLALLAGYYWYEGTLADSVVDFLYLMSVHYDRAYGCGVLILGNASADATVNPAMYAAASLIAMALCRTLCGGRRSWLAVLMALLPLAACLAAMELVPDTLWLYLLLAGLTLVILTGTLRRTDPKQGIRMTALAAIPVLLAVGLLFLAVPRDGYRAPSKSESLSAVLAEKVTDLIEDNPLQQLLNFSGSSTQITRTDLTQVGRMTRSAAIVMDLSGSAKGTIYLRGQSMNRYDGTSWTAGALSSHLSWPSEMMLKDAGTLEIQTRATHAILYVPYYAIDVIPDEDTNCLKNPDNRTAYTYHLGDLDRQFKESSFRNIPENNCLQLPDSTKRWAKELVAQILPYPNGMSISQRAEAIKKYVSNSAVYSLTPGTMPREYTDFAQWFLMEQDAGYCVHFATAATVLLRAAGIPARYTTGYMVYKDQDTATVRAKHAHAWAEYWAPGIGWKILEATPAAADTDIPAGPVTLPVFTEPSTTAPSQTAPTTVTTPSDTTPAATAPQPGTPTEPGLPGLRKGLSWLTTIALSVGLLVFQWKLRLALRLRRLKRGSTNARAIAMWREAVFLARLLSEQPGKNLFTTAQKAKFSQHILIQEELAPMEAYLEQARSRLRRKKLPMGLVYRLLLAVC